MLTNVLWDAQLHYPANAFENMLEWIFSTINYFIEKSDIQLLLECIPQKKLEELNLGKELQMRYKKIS